MKSFFISHSSKETKDFAKNLARQILLDYKSQNLVKKNALVLGLEGQLGTGKTTFAQGFAKGLGVKEKILSPTFVILKKFEIPAFAKASAGMQKSSFTFFYHIDCYRIKKPKELLALGWKGIMENPQNIILVEWAARIKKILPKDVPWVQFEHGDKNKRSITIGCENKRRDL